MQEGRVRARDAGAPSGVLSRRPGPRLPAVATHPGLGAGARSVRDLPMLTAPQDPTRGASSPHAHFLGAQRREREACLDHRWRASRWARVQVPDPSSRPRVWFHSPHSHEALGRFLRFPVPQVCLLSRE